MTFARTMGQRVDQIGVLLSDPASAPLFRPGRRVRLLPKPQLSAARRYAGILVVSSATRLLSVAEVTSAVNREHRLRGLLVRQDVSPGLVAPMIDRAGLRLWRSVLLHQGPPVPARVLAAWEAEAEDRLIADASISDGVLFVLSCALERLEVPVAELEVLRRVPRKSRASFHVSDDGSYLHWPDGDVHLDLESLRYATDPDWRLQTDAARISHDRRFGQAVRAVRERHGLRQGGFPGLSARHVGRIEHGAFPKLATLRLMAATHGLGLDDYLGELALACGLGPPGGGMRRASR